MTNGPECGFLSLENMDDLKKCVPTYFRALVLPTEAIMPGCVLTFQSVSVSCSRQS